MSCMQTWEYESAKNVPSESDRSGVTTNRSTFTENVTQRFPKDPNAAQTMRLIESSGSLEFWENDDEDIYSVEDGEPA